MQSANEMVVEQRPALKTFQESAAAPIKSILFVVHDDDGLEARLQAALSLARACSAHLKLLQVIPTASYTIVDPLGANFASAAIVEALEVQAAEVRNRLELHLSKEDASWNYEVTTAPTLSELVQNAALADLVVMGRQPKWHEFSRTGPGLLGAMLCNTRTPLCIPGDGRQNFDPFGTAVIAWNGSVEAANAVRASIGMLRMSSQVRVVRFTEDKEVGFPDTGLVEFLSRHGISAELDIRTVSNDFADDLVDYARVYRAEYVVMGGYSHSRAGEFLFGGVTRALLRACPTSLIMAH